MSGGANERGTREHQKESESDARQDVESGGENPAGGEEGVGFPSERREGGKAATEACYPK